ncbi:MAG: DNA-binding transcriptional response regulator [Verrucomicrobia bacterium]|jgi:DNA-binding NtrC family response regulator|nr:MAG: DNA-binding transcriptional response regulator [Verrucomicrobiota bacterium]
MTKRKILVIDDEEDICEMTKILLEKAGHDVTCTTDSRVAARLLKEQKFEAVITDMLMPDKDGLEVMADLRRHHPEVRIIAASGGGRVSSESYLHIARKSGAHALLPKPFTLQELLSCVETAFATQPGSTTTAPIPGPLPVSKPAA